jgi:hypothetical protein
MMRLSAFAVIFFYRSDAKTQKVVLPHHGTIAPPHHGTTDLSPMANGQWLIPFSIPIFEHSHFLIFSGRSPPPEFSGDRVGLSAAAPRSFLAAGFPLQSLTHFKFPELPKHNSSYINQRNLRKNLRKSARTICFRMRLYFFTAATQRRRRQFFLTTAPPHHGTTDLSPMSNAFYSQLNPSR